MGCFIFDNFLVSFHDIDILYIGFLMFHQFPPQFYHLVIVVTQFCDFSPFSHQFSVFWWFIFFTLFFIIFHFIMFVVCFSRWCFSEKWEKCVFASSVNSFFGAYHHSGTILKIGLDSVQCPEFHVYVMSISYYSKTSI